MCPAFLFYNSLKFKDETTNMTFIHHLQNLLTNIESTNLYILTISAFVALTLTFLILAVFTTKNKNAKSKSNDMSHQLPITITSHDIKAIAGEDIIATQLDLARAYIEMDKKQLAKKILDHVTQYGDETQQRAARELAEAL